MHNHLVRLIFSNKSSAVWYIWYVLRNPDSDHLESSVFRLCFIVGNSCDVIAIIRITLFIIVFTFYIGQIVLVICKETHLLHKEMHLHPNNKKMQRNY